MVESCAEGFEPGDCVWRAKGCRDNAIVTAGEPALAGIATLARIDTSVAPAEKYLGPLGAMGVTAYAGLIDAAELREGDVVWGSAATGAVGDLAAQIAKLRGHRVIGSAGSEEKVRYLLDELGLDAAFNYRDGPVVHRLREAAPDGSTSISTTSAATASRQRWPCSGPGDGARSAVRSQSTSRSGPRPGLAICSCHGEQPHPARLPRKRLPAPPARRRARARRVAGRGPTALSRDDHRRPRASAGVADTGAVRQHHGQFARAGRLVRSVARTAPAQAALPVARGLRLAGREAGSA